MNQLQTQNQTQTTSTLTKHSLQTLQSHLSTNLPSNNISNNNGQGKR